MRRRNAIVALLTLGMFVAVSGVVHAGIVAHYTFDNAGDRYADVTGNGWQGALGGSGTTFVPGVSGDAMRTTTGSKMNVANYSTGQGEIAASLSSYTISFWATDSANSWDNWVAFGSDSFFLQNTGSNTLAMYNPGGTPGYAGGSIASTSAFGSTLKHVALTADSAAGNVNLYIDGSLEDTAAWTVAPTGNLGWFTVGGAFNTGIRNIAADIDDVQVYDEALSRYQVRWLSENPGAVAPVPEPSTMVIWALGLLGLTAYARRRK